MKKINLTQITYQMILNRLKNKEIKTKSVKKVQLKILKQNNNI